MSGESRLRHVAAMDPPGRGSIATEEARGALAELDAARARLAALERTVSEEEAQKWADPRLTPHFVRKLRVVLGALDAVSAAETGSASLGDLERQIKALVDQYNARHRGETGCTCRTILAGMTAHGCPRHDRHDEDE